MGWKRRKPLWPFVGALTILLVLAVDAPRNWQPQTDELASARMPGMPEADMWYNRLFPPHNLPALPGTSPVEAPQLPRFEEPEQFFPMESVEQIHIPSAEGLPLREEFTLDTLLQIRGSLEELVGRLPALPNPDRSSSQHTAANRVLLSSPSDRLAMREEFDRALVDPLPPPIETQHRLEVFADELMESVKRSRQGLKSPMRMAARNPQPVASREIPSAKSASTSPAPTPNAWRTIGVLNPCPGLIEEAAEVRTQLAENLSVAVRTVRNWELTELPPDSGTPLTANSREELTFEQMPVTPVDTAAPATPSEAKAVASQRTEKEAGPVDETPPTLPLLRFHPQALIERLQRVPSESPASSWSQETLRLVRKLADDPTTTAETAQVILNDLQHQVTNGREQAEQVADHALRQHWLRLAQALECRTAIWRHLLDPQLSKLAEQLEVSSADDTETLSVLNEIASLLDGDANGETWRDYLLLDQIAAATSAGAASDTRARRKLAHEVLSRIEDPRLTAAQSEFVKSPPVSQLKKCLVPWALGPVDMETLAALVERYDAQPDARYAAALRQFKQRLQWSPVAEHQQLARHLDEHFRGANMRLAISSDLISRMLPKVSSRMAPVNDHIVGTKIKGRSRTTVDLGTEMIPNEEAWQISLQAKGAVFSRTHSETWPAKVNNAAKMFYDAQKTIWIDGQGMRVSETKATVKGRNDLVGIDSEFDPIPLLGHLVRDVARRKHQKTHRVALKQAKAKVARQAKERMDQDTNRKLHDLEQKFADNILSSMEQLALIAEPIEMYTTTERAVMRMRLANSLQLAASSLRPLAPSDSLASVQLHESVLNNAVAGLQLEGRTLTALQLHHFIASRLGRPGEQPPEGLPLLAKIEFAPYDAVRFNCRGDRLEVVLNVSEVSHGRDKVCNFAVHAFFRPEVNGLDVRLVRDGTLQFEGRRLRFGERAALHGVFNKLLRKDQQVQLVKHDLSSDPRLEGLMVTQLVIDDGWIGLALGPEYTGRSAWRTLPHVVR